MRTNQINARAEELVEGYEDAYNEAFNDEFRTFIEDEFSEDKGEPPITKDDVQGFLDSFTFPDEGDWAFDQVQSELDETGDQKYEQMRDEKMGL